MYKFLVYVLLGLIFSFAKLQLFAQDITHNTFGKGIEVAARDSSMTMKFSLRFSTLYEGYHNLDTKQYLDNVLIRRFRLKFDGFIINPKLVYKVEIGISNRDIGGVNANTGGAVRLLLDGVLKWNFAGNFVLWFGQTKLPGNRERVVSSQKMQFVDRSLLNARFNLDRDIGIQLHHHHNLGRAVVREIFSVSKGEGRNITVVSSPDYDYTGRIEYLPFGLFKSKGDYFESDLAREPKPKLSVGVTYDFNDGANRQRGQLGDFMSEARSLYTWFVDAIYKHKGYSAMFEFADRQAEGGAVIERDTNGDPVASFYTGTAYNLQMSYLFKNNYEIAGRGTVIYQDPATGRQDIRQYTLGFSKYVLGHNLKAQADISYTDIVDGTDGMQYRFQVEMSF